MILTGIIIKTGTIRFHYFYKVGLQYKFFISLMNNTSNLSLINKKDDMKCYLAL